MSVGFVPQRAASGAGIRNTIGIVLHRRGPHAGTFVNESPQHSCPGCASGVTRRDALRLGLGAGAAAAIAPHVDLVGVSPTYDTSAAELAVARQLHWPPPPIVTRAEWGADESIRRPGADYDSTIEKLIVHHTVTPNNPPDPAAVLRSIYSYAVSRDYIDVPYNWLIDHTGRIYEGRWARDYPAGAVHNGESANDLNVRGAHALNHNPRTIGIAFMGTYTTTLPPQPAIDSLVTLLAWKSARWAINPLASVAYRASDGSVAAFPNICGHRAVRATTCPGDPVLSILPSLRAQVAARLRRGTFGYWVATSDGRVLSFGDFPDRGDASRSHIGATVIGLASHPNGRGYWLFGPDGGVFTFGEARFHGSTGAIRLNRPIVGMAATPSGNGYWLVASDGGIFNYGDAKFYGSTGAIRLNRPIVGMAPTPSGHGYWLVASDGGIFSFGDAKFFGSTGAIALRQPVVGMASTPKGRGYWLVARDGGIFSFGDARFHGSAGAHGTPQPVVGMVATNTGRGYAILLRDGSVYAYGDAPFYGSAYGQTTRAVGFAGKLLVT
jgi:ribosomal protein L24E